MNVKAPLVAAKAEAGQFIILRSDKDGERLPFTIADSDRETGEISIVFQAEGSSTKNSRFSKREICLKTLWDLWADRRSFRG